MSIRAGTGSVLTFTTIEDTTSNTGGTTTDVVRFQVAANYTHGTGSGQIDRQLTRTVTGQSGNAAYILSNFANATGSGLAMVKVRRFILKNTGAVDITYGPDATNGWTGFVSAAKTLAPGGVVCFDDPAGGLAVTAGSNDRLRIGVPSGSGDYELGVGGTSA